jgi:integrase/recombinase XerC
MSTIARDRVGALLSDGIERTPAMIGRDLGLPGEQTRTLLHRMAKDEHVLTRGDGYYFATAATQRRLVNHTARRTGPPPVPMLPIIAEHVQHLRRRGLRDSTIEKRRRAISRLAKWLEMHDTELLAATSPQLIDFCDLVRGVEGRRSRVNDVSGFYRWAHTVAELLERDPSIKLIRPRMPAPNPRPIGEERLARALAEADDTMRIWLLLAAYCGLRACEIAPLHTDDVRLADLTLVVRSGKGGKSRSVPLPPIVVDALTPRLTGSWLWPSPAASRPISADHVSKRANRFLHRIGIADTLHSLRHRYGTKMYDVSGFDLRLTQDVMGHSSPATTAMYVAVDARASAAGAALLPIPS